MIFLNSQNPKKIILKTLKTKNSKYKNSYDEVTIEEHSENIPQEKCKRLRMTFLKLQKLTNTTQNTPKANYQKIKKSHVKGFIRKNLKMDYR